MVLGVSRETWTQIGAALVLTIAASGLGMLLTAVALDAANQPNAAFWARNSVIAFAVAGVGLIAGFFTLYATRPKQTTESPSRLVRIWRFLRRIRIGLAPTVPISIDDLSPAMLEFVSDRFAKRAEKARQEDSGDVEQGLALTLSKEREAHAATKRDLDDERAKRKQREDDIRELLPRAEWADELIEKERKVSLIEITRTALWHQEGLKADEPFFEIGIIFRYNGVLQLILNAFPPIGHIALSGEEFAIEPKITIDWKQPLPFNAVGPTGGIIRIRQHLQTKERAESLRKRLRLDEPELLGKTLEVEMNFLGLNLWLWLKSRFEDEPVRDGRLLPEHLTLEYMIER